MRKAIVLIGTQGSGKSTYAKELESATMKRASQDDIRLLLWPTDNYNANYAKYHKKSGLTVRQMWLQAMHHILKLGLDVIVDETHHLKVQRTGMVKYLKEKYPGITVEAHYIRSSLERCLRRNAKRPEHKRVPEPIVEEFYEALIRSFGPYADDTDHLPSVLFGEGFDTVKIINKF